MLTARTGAVVVAVTAAAAIVGAYAIQRTKEKPNADPPAPIGRLLTPLSDMSIKTPPPPPAAQPPEVGRTTPQGPLPPPPAQGASTPTPTQRPSPPPDQNQSDPNDDVVDSGGG